MDKESIIELQRMDANCNDCKFLRRDLNKKQLLDNVNEIEQRKEFIKEREQELFEALTLRDKSALAKLKKKDFQFRRSPISYGHCTRFDFKEVSFIPGTCQLETQGCFQHRRYKS